MKSEPSLLVGAIVAVFLAVVAFLVAMGISIPEEVSNKGVGLIIAIGALVSIIQATWTRQQVFAPDTVQEIKAEKLAEGKAIGQQMASHEMQTRRFPRPEQTG
jgi:NADH:ubiquinone oxidoreductase subunit 6 (subunit J)